MRFPNKQSSPTDWSRTGFSLIELLVTMTILGLLLSVTLPSISSLGRSFDLTRSTTSIAELVEMARSHAKASNAKVEVGFLSGVDGVEVAIVAAREGTNFTALSRIHKFPRVRLAIVPESERPAADVNLARQQAGMLPSFQLNGKTFDRVLSFNSRGEARVLDHSLARCIEIGLLPNIGGETPSSLEKNFGVVQVTGLSGGVVVFR